MRILVVEDEVELADALARGLRREGYAVDVANDVAGAVDRLSVAVYDLVTLDLNLPDGDGLDLAQRLREDPALAPAPDEPAPRVLVLTARDGVGERVVGLDRGADDYLVKPFAFAELSARVRSLLRRDAGRSGAVLSVGDLRLDTALRPPGRHAARPDRQGVRCCATSWRTAARC
ncbi:MAG: response regulator [Acidimicrobiales bacterium]